MRWGWIPTNPLTRRKCPVFRHRTSARLRPQTLSDCSPLPEAADPLRDFPLGGCRHWGQEERAAGFALVRYRRGVGPHEVARGLVNGPTVSWSQGYKTHGVRRVALAQDNRNARGHRRPAEAWRKLRCRLLAPDAYVFSHEADSSGHWRPDSIRGLSACWSTGRCPRRAPHDFRHYVATRLLAAGVDVRTVAGRLGHRNVSTTLNVYAHFVLDADEEPLP